ncbi:unnamed protein product, partial [Rotaria socialis]
MIAITGEAYEILFKREM